MDTLNIITLFLYNIVVYNIPLLYGTVGEIITEKSGSLNLGVEGIIAVQRCYFGYIVGCYANSLLVGILISFAAAGLLRLVVRFPDSISPSEPKCYRSDYYHLWFRCLFLCW